MESPTVTVMVSEMESAGRSCVEMESANASGFSNGCVYAKTMEWLFLSRAFSTMDDSLEQANSAMRHAIPEIIRHEVLIRIKNPF